ncbi:TetR/AcrR family transcriptional regulator [Streptomyces johnsoniae]|uniref:TetR/AcrR family transcriptional regulator n=1 Tax=Streptomyces johnsoniae TaxID=3075532 RepID=A0ABU2S5Z1_9ACTN|nr:TetR/AcrR family transcriptional regulator [Streptomyces sp. DSM 41886]MDT0444401.1 TetR/AcrR family transcriptional regulator [Streptomyces sp. DSM 41886]
MQGVKDAGAPVGLRERKKRATRAALAEAAVRLAAEHGVDNVTVEAISEAADVSPRTFFNYFDSRDDAFVTIDAEVGTRIREAVLAAPPSLDPLTAVHRAFADELADVERHHEVWNLRAEVLKQAPHLMVRTLGAHLEDEQGLARAIAQRLDPGSPEPERPGLYPRLLAAVAGTAVRISIEHWSAAGATVPFLAVFERVFTHLAAGLPAPPPDDR